MYEAFFEMEHTPEFYNAVVQRGFRREKRRDGRFVLGLCLAEKRSQGIQHHLRVPLCGNLHALAVLVVDDIQRPVCDDDAVTCAEALFHIPGKVQPLLDQHHRVFADFLGLLHQREDILRIPAGAFLHLLIVKGKLLCRVFGFHPKGQLQLVFAQAVGIGALLRVFAARILIIFTEPRRRRAGKPPVAGGCGQ